MDLYSFSQRRSVSPGASSAGLRSTSFSAGARLPPPRNPLEFASNRTASTSRFIDALFDKGTDLLDSDEEYTGSRFEIDRDPSKFRREQRHELDTAPSVGKALLDANNQRRIAALLRRYHVDEHAAVARVKASMSERGTSTASVVTDLATVLETDAAITAAPQAALAEAFVRSSATVDNVRRDLRFVGWRNDVSDFLPRETVARVHAAASPATSRSTSHGTGNLMRTRVSQQAAQRYRLQSSEIPKDIDPDYRMLSTPEPLTFGGVDRTRGSELVSNPHLVLSSLPTNMLVDTSALGVSVSSLWDHEALRRGIHDDTLFADPDEARSDPSIVESSAKDEAQLFRTMPVQAGEQTQLLDKEVLEAGYNPIAQQDHVLQQYVQELKERGLRPPAELTLTERVALTAVEHAPGVFVGGKFWDPFHALDWWSKGLDHDYVTKYCSVVSFDRDASDVPKYADRFGNVVYGPMAAHPFRQWMVDYYAEKKVGPPHTTQIDESLAKNMSNLWTLEQKLIRQFGKAKSTEPLSSKYFVKYPPSAKIPFTSTNWVPELPEELVPKAVKGDGEAKGPKGKKADKGAAKGDSKASGSKEKEGTKDRAGASQEKRSGPNSKEKGGSKDKATASKEKALPSTGTDISKDKDKVKKSGAKAPKAAAPGPKDDPDGKKKSRPAASSSPTSSKKAAANTDETKKGDKKAGSKQTASDSASPKGKSKK